MTEKVTRAVVYVLVLIAHVTAYLEYRLSAVALHLPQGWHLQITLLLLASLFLSTLMPFVKNRGALYTLLGGRSVILLLAGIPMGASMSLEFALLVAVALEATTYAPLAGGVAFSLLLLGVVILLQRPVEAAGHLLEAASGLDVLAFTLYSVLFVALCCLLRLFRERYTSGARLREQLDEAALELAKTNMELQEYAALSEEKAIVNERKRLARDLHDTLGYTLTNLIMMMEAGIDLSAPADVQLREHLKRARAQAQVGLAEVRRTLQAIRKVEELGISGLKAVHRLVQSFDRATHIRIRLNLGDVPWSFGAEKDQIAYRFVQEGITNALRHGRASEIAISFARMDGGVSISIVDNGVGFQDAGEGYGLLGMHERIEQAGGRTEIRSVPREGTRLSAWLPLREGT